MMREWKDVVGFEGIYQVSNDGEVKALERDVDYGNRICHRKERILSKHFSTDGYYMVKLLDNKNHSVHRLVAMAFIGIPNNDDMEVDHINAIRTDNSVDNLRWVSHYENLTHTYELGNGHMSNRNYSDNYNSKQISIFNEEYNKIFGSIKECAEWFKNNFRKNTKLSSIYDSIRKHNINRTPYCGYYIKY